MKKALLIFCLALFSAAWAQKKSDNIFHLEEKRKSDINLTARAPGTPGDPDPVPIDDYIPLLMVAGGALIFYYGRKVRAYSRD